MDFVYICRDGQNEELRYSIRSVMHFYPEAVIHIFGGKPDWYSGNYTEVENIGNKFDNINECYKAICKSNISNFILMNDDFFIINKPNDFIHYYDGTIDDKIQSHTNIHGLSKYSRILSEANKKLKSMGINSPLNYDIHTPMLFNVEKLKAVVDLSFAPRSMYGNIYSVGGEKIVDVKVYKSINLNYKNEYFLSTEDNSFNKVFDFLNKKFIIKSIHENDF